jgi:hypothetical protein
MSMATLDSGSLALLSAVLLASAGLAAAQAPPPGTGATLVVPNGANVIVLPPPPPPPAPVASGGSTDATLIAGCLCAQQRVQDLHKKAMEAQRAFKQAQASLDAMNHQLETSKASVNVNDPQQVDAQRGLVEQDEQAKTTLYSTTLPATQASVDTYNQAVSDYNSRCINKIFDSAAFSAVTQTLNCVGAP